MSQSAAILAAVWSIGQLAPPEAQCKAEKVRRYVIALMLVALFVPLGATAASPQPFFAGGSLGGPTQVAPGSMIEYRYRVAGRDVQTLTVSLVLPSQMHVVRKRSPWFAVVNGRPTWEMRGVNNYPALRRLLQITVCVGVSRTAQVGASYRVGVDETARSNSWTKHHSAWMTVRVVKGPTGSPSCPVIRPDRD